ncbi:type I restriction-modification enzyme R subunit C-terminal domain-containing protein [Kocuria aegyptia]|uniref:type I restriction-modification enzyme R subunit C-terminal domain-containing protein n=1 Tax=Kocuria aegyptia TaxID=330943 RepID=UPI0031E24A82
MIDAVVETGSHDGARTAVDPLWLETVRRKLRDLLLLLEKRKCDPVDTNFEDVRGELAEIDLKGVNQTTSDVSYYRERVALHLRGHLDHIAMQRLRHGRALTTLDLAASEKMLRESDAGSREDLERASAGDVTGYIRSLGGLGPQAAPEAFTELISGSTLNTRRLKLLNMLICQLTPGGRTGTGALHQPPYTELAPHGPEDLFSEDTVKQILAVLDRSGGRRSPCIRGATGETASLAQSVTRQSDTTTKASLCQKILVLRRTSSL